jgi:hypothetical protein
MDSDLPDWVLNNTITGYLTLADLKVLYKLSSSLPENSIIIEIGSLHGKSSVQLSRSSPTSTIHCFDFWDGLQFTTGDGTTGNNTLERFNFFTKNYPNIKPKQITVSPHGAEWVDQLVDMVFIDASHTNPSDWNIIEYWLPKIKKGGILSGHDYYVKFPDVIENVNKLEKILNQSAIIHNIGPDSCSVWSFTV